MEKYREYRVTELPTSNLVEGDKYYLLLENNEFRSYIVGSDLQLHAERGSPVVYTPVFADDFFDI